MPVNQPELTECILRESYKKSAMRHLAGAAAWLFAELTGWRLQVRWAPSSPRGWKSPAPLCRSTVCRCARGSPEQRAQCEAFAATHLAHILRAAIYGHEFTCPVGIHNYWFPLTAGPLCWGLLFFQVLPRWLRPAGAGHGPIAGRRGSKGGPHGTEVHRFQLACRLIRLLAHDAVASVLAEARKQAMGRLEWNVIAHEHLEGALRAALHTARPFLEVHPAERQRIPHRAQVVHRLLDSIDQGYAQPLRLEEFARAFGLNTAYLSSLFSKAVGRPFRSYVKELRLEKAQQLLADQSRSIKEIAYAIGYHDPNRLRLDFKELTGLSPSAWRDTLVLRHRTASGGQAMRAVRPGLPTASVQRTGNAAGKLLYRSATVSKRPG